MRGARVKWLAKKVNRPTIPHWLWRKVKRHWTKYKELPKL